MKAREYGKERKSSGGCLEMHRRGSSGCSSQLVVAGVYVRPAVRSAGHRAAARERFVSARTFRICAFLLPTARLRTPSKTRRGDCSNGSNCASIGARRFRAGSLSLHAAAAAELTAQKCTMDRRASARAVCLFVCIVAEVYRSVFTHRNSNDREG